MLWDMPRFFLHKGPAFRSFTATYVIMIYAPFDHFEGAKGRCVVLVAFKNETLSDMDVTFRKGKLVPNSCASKTEQGNYDQPGRSIYWKQGKNVLLPSNGASPQLPVLPTVVAILCLFFSQSCNRGPSSQFHWLV